MDAGGRAVSGTKAEESRRVYRDGEGIAGFSGWRIRLSFLCVVIPAVRDCIIKPLDSSLRWNDAVAIRYEAESRWNVSNCFIAMPVRPRQGPRRLASGPYCASIGAFKAGKARCFMNSRNEREKNLQDPVS